MITGNANVANGSRLESMRSTDAAVMGSQVAIQYADAGSAQKSSARFNENSSGSLPSANPTADRSASLDRKGRSILKGSSISSMEGEFGLDAKMQAIQQETDIDKKLLLLVTLHGDLAEFRANGFQKFITVAEKQLGLPTLREHLRRSELGDKADPLYPRYNMDSTQTAKIRAALMSAEGMVRETAENIAASDPGFNRTVVLANSFIANQEKLIESSQKRAEETELKSSLLDERWVRATATANRTDAATERAAFEASREALDQARKATDYAKESAAGLRDELSRSTVRSRNGFQVAILVFLIIALAAYIVRTIKRK